MDRVNIYETEFSAPCPVNGAQISYRLRIETPYTIPVEDILSATSAATGLHEEIADSLKLALGGHQTLSAYHHGVSIETKR